MYTTLVLSGGGVKGILMLGAIQYMIDNRLLEKTTTYIGTSVGAMIGYLLAIGYTPIEIVAYLCNHGNSSELTNFDISRGRYR